MSWEVLTMKSKISFFNSGIFKSMLKRFWPMWTAYFVVWFMSLPLPSLVSKLLKPDDFAVNMVISRIHMSLDMSLISAALMAVLAAMAVFSFLYNSRSAGMIASAPVRREAVFCSSFLAGLLPVVAANLLIAVLNALFTSSSVVTVPYIIKANAILFAVGSMEYLVFFSLASLIAMLTANIVALPVLYIIFNFVFVGMEYIIKTLYGMFVFGFNEHLNSSLEFTSPIIYFNDHIKLSATADKIVLSGWNTLIVYCLIGVVLFAVALLLYRKRRMETAGDVIAVKCLKPVFKYCVTACASLCFGLLFYVIISSLFSSLSASLLVLTVGLLIGAFIGYFASEMLLKKSLHVFSGHWKGYIIVAVLCVVFAFACVTDLLDLSAKLPDADDIQSVTCSADGFGYDLTERSDIEAMLKVNKAVIAERDEYMNIDNPYSEDVGFIGISYYLKNGSVVSRDYLIYKDDNYKAYYAVLASTAVIKSHFTPSIEVTVQNVYEACFEYTTDTGDGQTIQLTPEQAVDFYRNALMTDIENGAKKPVAPQSGEMITDTVNRAYVLIDLVKAPEAGIREETYDTLTIEIDPDCTECIKWIKANLDVDLTF